MYVIENFVDRNSIFITESPHLTRMTGPRKNRVRRNRALRGYCYLVNVLISLQNVFRLRNQS